jgi:hypothetical protein
MLPSSVGLPFFSLAVAADRNLRATEVPDSWRPAVLACKQVSTAPIHEPLRMRPGLSRAWTLTGLRPVEHPTNFRLGFKRLPLQAWLAS